MRVSLTGYPKSLLGSLLLISLIAVSCRTTQPSTNANPLGVRIFQTNEVLRVELNGRLFTEYHYQNVPRPFCYPLIGPGGVGMTRNFPMQKVEGEETDHPHHRSLWFAHDPVNGVDFWTEGPRKGRIVHRGFVDISSGVSTGLIKTRNDWVAPDGKVILTDEQTLRFYPSPDNTTVLMDFDVTLKASHGDVIFGDSKEGTFALRIAESMRALHPIKRGERPRAGDGQIVLSTGVRDDGASAVAAKSARKNTNTWGKRAAWCDYFGPVNGKLVGIAIMDHPSNPRHPTWWMVRDYGLFAANPFGQSAYENLSDKHAGDFKISNGQSVTFRYRVVLHEGDEKNGRIAERYEEFVRAYPVNLK